MRKLNQRLIVTLASLLLAVTTGHAIEGLKLQILCPDVVLTWPSTNGETYLVQYRATLDTNSAWVTLTNYLPAAPGTNVTLFVHSNQVDCPVGQVFGMMSMSGSESMAARTTISSEERKQILQEREAARLAALYEKCAAEGRAPYEWELKNQPPLPPSSEEVRAKLLAARASKLSAPTTELLVQEAALDGPPSPGSENDPVPEGGGGAESSCGFYRVVRNSVHLVGLTNGMVLSGTVNIPVEVGHDEGVLAFVALTENGASLVRDVELSAPFSGLPIFCLNTTLMSNGPHTIAGSASWALTNLQSPYFEADSELVEVVVSNAICFPDWMPSFGQDYDACLFTAQTAYSNADWYIDVYDSQDVYIGTAEGTTANGAFGFAWNLIDADNVRHDDDFFYSVITVLPVGGGAMSATSPKVIKNKDRWTGRGDWVVANQLAWSQENGYVGGDDLNTMTDQFLQAAEIFGMNVLPGHPYNEAFRIRYEYANDPGPTADWAAFRQALYHPASRNLFYSGHGSATGIGANLSNTNRSISVAEITNVLHTVPAGQTNRHGFRFVFLDGCETAKNGNLAGAFGIVPKVNVGAAYYGASGEHPSAFVGWNKSPTAGYANHVVNVNHWKYIMSFIARWTVQPEGLRLALDNAQRVGAFPNNINTNHLTVYGYKDLGYRQGNN